MIEKKFAECFVKMWKKNCPLDWRINCFIEEKKIEYSAKILEQYKRWHEKFLCESSKKILSFPPIFHPVAYRFSANNNKFIE